MPIQRVVIVSIFSCVGAMIYALYDVGIVLSELKIPLGIFQQLICIVVNLGIIGLVGAILACPLALFPIQKNNENWIGFVIGYTLSYALAGAFSDTIISTYWLASLAFVIFVIGMVIFSIYREIEEKIKMGSVLFVCFASVGGMAGYVPGKPRYGTPLENAPNVLIIAIDSLRFDHIASNGHPFINTAGIDQLKMTGVSFENAFAQSSDLFDFYDQLMYGKEPWSTSVETSNIGEHFRGLGYQTGFFVGTDQLRGRYSQGFDVYDDDFAWIQGLSRSVGGRLINELIPFVPSSRLGEHSIYNLIAWLKMDSTRPFFAVLQLSDPSWPFSPPAPWSEDYYSGNPMDPSENSLSLISLSEEQHQAVAGITDLNFVKAQYAGEVAYVSKQVEQLLSDLDEIQQRENTCIILLASHGLSLGEQQQWFSTSASTDVNLFHIPVIFSFPKILPQGERRSALLEISDITPTILELLVQDNFSSSGTGMANALYGASGRPYVRSVAQYPSYDSPMLWFNDEQMIWLDENEDIQTYGNVSSPEQYREELHFTP